MVTFLSPLRRSGETLGISKRLSNETGLNRIGIVASESVLQKE